MTATAYIRSQGINPADIQGVKSLLRSEVTQFCKDEFKATVKVSFANRGGKHYVTFDADDSKILFNDNSYYYQKGLRKIVEKICPDARMTSGGVNCFTFRLNKDLPVVKKSRKRIQIVKSVCRGTVKEVLASIGGKSPHLLVMEDNTVFLADATFQFNAPRNPTLSNQMVHSVIIINAQDV